MRTRLFLVALPVAVLLALWLGPGLSPDDVLREGPLALPPAEGEPVPAADPEPAAVDLECEPPHDPGPDGDL
ncbi:MAG: hypothetical protein JNK02_04535 [Planctomycetes bacterium]|nr:hypothetical protein [Planctomycetota bacterium]